MGANYVQVAPDNLSGKKLQTWNNTISTNDVHTEAVVITNSSGVEYIGFPIINKPDGTGTYATSNVTSSAYEASHVIKSSAGVLFLITGYSSRTSGQFIQLHNATSLPSDTTGVTGPLIWVPANSNFSLDFGRFGRYFSTGIVICNSSTGPTKTLGSSDCWFDAQYL